MTTKMLGKWAKFGRKADVFLTVFMAFFLVFLSGSLPLQASENENGIRSAITDLVIAGDETNVRLVIDISEIGDISSFVLSAPYRLVIDLHDSDFSLPADRTQGDPGFIEKVRFGKGPNGDARLVITSAKPLELKQSFYIPSEGSDAARVIFDLEETSEINFRLAVARAATAKTFNLSDRSGEKIEPKKAENRQTKKSENNQQVSAGSIPRIVIDPGHGGRDGGASAVGNSRLIEKNVVLDFSKELATALRARGNVAIKLTRNDDRKVSLARRVEIAREFDADLFVSIHADSFPRDRSVGGATVYTLSDKASGEVAAIIAEQENKADFIAGYRFNEAPDDVVDILLDLTRRETKALSANFAKYVITNLKTQIRFFKRPHQTGAFRVLKAPDIPSALIELGYLSNAEDVARIASEEWRANIADKLATVIMEYLKGVDALQVRKSETR